MQRFIKSIVLFSVYAFLLYSLLLLAWGHFFPNLYKQNLKYRAGGYGHMQSRLNEVKTYDTVDILFLGQSRCYRSFDPRIFKQYGLTIFNLGSSSQTPLQTEVLFSRYGKILRPKWVIYEVSPLTFSVDGVESALDLISNDQSDWDLFKMVCRQNHPWVYNTWWFSFMQNGLGLGRNIHEEKIKGNDTYIKGGYVESTMIPFAGNAAELHQFTWIDQQFKAFTRIIQKIKSEKTPYFLVQVPVTLQRGQGYTETGMMDSMLNRAGIYYNYSTSLMLKDSICFLDDDHLNQKGVAIFDSLLIATLKLKH